MKFRSLIAAALVCLPLLSPVMAEAQAYTPVPVTISKDKVRGDDGKVYWSHVVLERQTLFSISKAYGVSVDDIYKANPSIKKEGLKVNSVILIPISSGDASLPEETGTPEKESTAATPAGDEDNGQDGYFIHVVKWYEDINDISGKYGIPAETILSFNGLNKGKKLKSRTKLKIPVLSQEETEPAAEDAGQEAVAENEDADNSEEADENFPDRGYSLFGRKNNVTVTLLLPLSANGKPSSNHFDFYSGALLAVRDLASEGISTKLNVFDISSGLPDDAEDKIQESDFVIGPVSTLDIARTLSLTSKGIPVISPLDQKAGALVTGNPNLIQAPGSYEAQYEDLVKWIRSDLRGNDKVIIITEKGARATEATTSLDSLLTASGMDLVRFSYSILEGRNIVGSLGAIMTEEGVNRVIINSESGAFLYDAVRNLNLILHNKAQIILYSPARIRSFDTIETENLHNLNLHVCLSYYLDYDDARVKKFLPVYRALFGTEPSQFAFQGYDITHYFISCATGRGWFRNLAGRTRERMLQCDFLFVHEDEGGYANDGIRRVVYESDYSLKLLR